MSRQHVHSTTASQKRPQQSCGFRRGFLLSNSGRTRSSSSKDVPVSRVLRKSDDSLLSLEDIVENVNQSQTLQLLTEKLMTDAVSVNDDAGNDCLDLGIIETETYLVANTETAETAADCNHDRFTVEKQLAQTLHRWRRHKLLHPKELRNSVTALVSQCPRHLIWDSLLDTIARNATLSHRLPEVRLAVCLLVVQTTTTTTTTATTLDDAFLSSLRNADMTNKKTRKRLLAAIHLLDLWLDNYGTMELQSLDGNKRRDQDRQELPSSILLVLIQNVVPLLARHVLRLDDTVATYTIVGNDKPTVLAQRIVDMVYRILTLVSQQALVQFEAKSLTSVEATNSRNQPGPSHSSGDPVGRRLVETVWEQSESVLVDLWKMNLHWVTILKGTVDAEKHGNWSAMSSKEIQARCKVAVLVNWQQYHQQQQQHHDMETISATTLNVDNNSNNNLNQLVHNDDGFAVKLTWCRCLGGTVFPFGVVGSLAQTLSPLEPSPSDSFLNNLLKGAFDDADYHDDPSKVTRCVAQIRALVAWIGQKRKHLGVLLDRKIDVQNLSWSLLKALTSNVGGEFADIILVAL